LLQISLPTAGKDKGITLMPSSHQFQDFARAGLRANTARIARTL
jgi:hypothetical protein